MQSVSLNVPNKNDSILNDVGGSYYCEHPIVVLGQEPIPENRPSLLIPSASLWPYFSKQ